MPGTAAPTAVFPGRSRPSSQRYAFNPPTGMPSSVGGVDALASVLHVSMTSPWDSRPLSGWPICCSHRCRGGGQSRSLGRRSHARGGRHGRRGGPAAPARLGATCSSKSSASQSSLGPFNEESREMTPTLKVRREEVERHRAAETEALYLLGRSRSPATESCALPPDLLGGPLRCQPDLRMRQRCAYLGCVLGRRMSRPTSAAGEH
jgi:hypothetical protein